MTDLIKSRQNCHKISPVKKPRVRYNQPFSQCSIVSMKKMSFIPCINAVLMCPSGWKKSCEDAIHSLSAWVAIVITK